MAEDDLDKQFALFERQIQSVTAKRPPTTTPAPAATTTQTATPANAHNLTPQALAPAHAPKRPREPVRTAPAIAPAATTAPSAASGPTPGPAAAISSRWKWDGSAWKWHVTTAVPPASAAAPVARPILSALPTHTPRPPAAHAAVHAPHHSPPTPPYAPPQPPHPAPPRPVKRSAAGEVWNDPTLAQWPADDHRIFVGDLAPDASDADLERAFSRYPSFNMARIVRDKRTGLCRGYGFVSFAAGEDMIAALKEMNGKYVGTRPVKLRKSTWQKRNLSTDRRKELKLFKEIVKVKRK